MASVGILHAQTTGPLYWNLDSDNGSIPIDATNAVSTDPAGNNPATYNLAGSDLPDFYFSSDKVGTEAQTIGLGTDEAYQFNTLNFLKGGITLSGDAALILGQGLTVGANAGPTAISLAGPADNLGTVGSTTFYSGTVYYLTNTWNNNSANALTLTGNVASFSGTETLTFNGTGTGAINISGSLSGKIDQESATSAVSLGDRSGITSLHLGNGAKIYFGTAGNYNTATTSTTGGELNFAGDTVLADGGSVVFNATSLTFGTGDALDESAVAQHITTLNLDGGSSTTFNRLLIGINGSASGLNLLANTTTLNVGNNYILDFGMGNNGGAGYTYTGTTNFASGSALEARGNTVLTLTNDVLPSNGAVTIGNDDVGSNDAFYLNGANTVSGTLTFHLKGGGVSTFVNGVISGAGGLSFDGASASNFDGQGEGAIWLQGTNTYSGATVLQYASGTHNYPVVVINGDSSGIGNEIDVKAGNLILADGAKIPTGSAISLGDPNSSQNSDNLTLQIGVNGGANVTVYDVQAVSPWNNPNDRGGDSIVGSGSTVSNLTWDVASGLDTFQGHIGGSNNNLALIKTGAGQLYLTSGNNTYSGGTTINAGTLSILSGQNFGAGDAALGVGTVTINNAATLNVVGTNGFLNQIVLGTKGTVTTASGDTFQVAGQITANNVSGGAIDSFYQDPNAATGNGQAGVVGGNGIAITGGDVLVNETVASTPGEVDILSGRLLMFNNNNFIVNATKVVTAGGILDFGAGGNQTVTAPIYFSDGGAIETRGTSTTITNLQPLVGTSGKMPTLTIGTDDVGGGSISVSNNVVLASSIEIIGHERDNSFTGVYFGGGFSGTGNITVDTAGIVPNFISQNNGVIVISGTDTYRGDTTVQGGILDLTGNNTGVTSAGGGAPNYYAVASSKPYIDGNNNPQNYYTPGILQVGAGGSLAAHANVVVGGSAGFAYFVLGDNNGASNVTVGSLTLSDSSAGINGGDNGAVVGGASGISTLTVNVAANSTDVYNGLFGVTHGYDFSNTSDGYINNNEENLAVTFNIGVGGTMMLGGFSDGGSIAGGYVVNGGTLEIYKEADALGQANVTLNGATLAISNGQYNGNTTKPHVILGTGTNSLNSLQGIDSFSGDVQTGAGSTGELHINGSNFIVNTDGTASTIKTLDIDSGRIFLFGGNGLNFIANNTVVNVNNAAFLDIATSATATITNQITFSNGSGLVTRNDNGNYTLTNAILPGSGSFTIGTDDSGGNNDSFNISSAQVLTGNLALHVEGNHYLPVTFSGNISGTGNIAEDSGGNGTGNLFLTGTNTYKGQTSAGFANLFINGDNSGVTGDYLSNFATVTIGHSGKISSNSNLLFGNGGGYGIFVLGDANGAVNQTVAGLVMESSGTSYVFNGNTHDSTNSVLTVNNGTADTYTGVLGNGTQTNTNGNNLALVKSGAGTLTLSGASTYTGGTTVTGGKLAVDGSIVGNASVGAGAEIGGHGSIGGTLSGAGTVGPGNSPGILTASAVDPSAGTSFNFEFTLAVPDFSNAANSGNDILHLEGGTPFTMALTSANAINLYFAGVGTFEGGFFTNGLVDNLTSNVANATYNYFVEDAAGSYSYNGLHYDLTTGAELTVPSLGANFGDGTVNGYTQEFLVAGAPAIPEPSTYALMGVALLVLTVVARRRRLV